MIQDKVLLEDWIVACRSEDVKEKPIQIILMGERLAIFRNSEGVHAFRDLCIHRGAALSLGEVKNDCIVCPYHGWEYNHDGECVRIPQLPEGRTIPKKAKAESYACMEKYGFIWVNLANNNPEFFRYEEMESIAFQNVIWGPQGVQAKPPRIIENFLDVGHLAVLHEGYLGAASHRVIQNYSVHKENGRIYTDEIPIYQPDPDGSGKPKYVYYTYEIMRPLTVKFTKRDHENNTEMTIVLTVRPVNENESVAYGILSFDYETGLTDEEIVKFQNEIFAQDKPIVENQKPEELPLDLQVELSLICDRMSIAYRQYLKELGVVLGTA
ncbi:aromatic ring-hydroxylating dioxygenase subunit alpha [Bacillus sp. DTU_2020_1000418_1_SI_GHA_SEK_038]|uniref:aromatic ring-hydroxylating dioxygenase subunit alpha n=1 Tax=Bacillus sp. DTU_2020_1000418_1_SI_GHA_SEK_038 TaxID=3077585 RepID=UPI0028E90A1C|nr:aromatic ring-hydroxylating dioxygenase subunit alpha [Bacillus sp. DTU_2020_1000418_1_SI_GHA_SEK_038]WNS76908.1 aromatic ring-hydroxylating dioxygenase subunit alpha [Bacillus sp. DTU_2020_1000418_1_SI_GHA_SEK_038]